MAYLIKDVIAQFDLEFKVAPYGNGHINDTYVADCEPRYILQRINSNVFKKPEEVMENIAAVCDFLREKIAAEGGDPDRETLSLIRTRDGKNYYKASDEDYFRVYKFIEDAYSVDIPETPAQFYNAARAFGKFQRLLSDFPAEKLYDTIVDFHNTGKRYENFEKAVSADKKKRLASVADEVEFVRQRKGITTLITDGMAKGTIPLRVTHNDTKLNNVMLDSKTHSGLCVVDLDTVMPGSLLYDFGDALRAGANTAAEDETDLSKVNFDLRMFEAFAKGFWEELYGKLPREVENLLDVAEVKFLARSCEVISVTVTKDKALLILKDLNSLKDGGLGAALERFKASAVLSFGANPQITVTAGAGGAANNLHLCGEFLKFSVQNKEYL